MIITIGRQLAAGGRTVGQILAGQLGLKYFDKELLLESARRSGIADELFLRADEHYNLFTLALKTDTQKLFQFQSDTIRQLAEEGDCLFLGRAADYILRDRKDLFTVFLSADMQDRVATVMKKEGMTEEEAAAFIEKTDRRRSDYYNFYTGKRWGDGNCYDLCLNTSRFGIEGTVEIIKTSVECSERLRFTTLQ
ncbi:MAG: cytidylate kinase-like family protein [Paludibacteraceae bacterium]|nr:cytidylate kinase-like family protein [Paludibacteraceae bacterium]